MRKNSILILTAVSFSHHLFRLLDSYFETQIGIRLKLNML